MISTLMITLHCLGYTIDFAKMTMITKQSIVRVYNSRLAIESEHEKPIQENTLVDSQQVKFMCDKKRPETFGLSNLLFVIRYSDICYWTTLFLRHMVFDISSLFYLPLRLLLFWFLKMPKTTLLLRHLLFRHLLFRHLLFCFTKSFLKPLDLIPM